MQLDVGEDDGGAEDGSLEGIILSVGPSDGASLTLGCALGDTDGTELGAIDTVGT